MTLESALTTFVVLLLYVLKPGPTILALISRSLSDGFRAGIAVAFGSSSAHVIYFLMAVFGYAIIETHLAFASFFLTSFSMAAFAGALSAPGTFMLAIPRASKTLR